MIGKTKAGSTPLKVYDQPHQFEPLLPQKELDKLALRSQVILQKSYELHGAAHPASRAQIRELVRSMNSYYSNLIEGQSTHPANIERALRQDFSSEPDTARRQRIALAHIEAERGLEAAEIPGERALSSVCLRDAHAAFFSRLSPADRQGPGGLLVEPGALRTQEVAVGRHQPPTWQSVSRFLEYADRVYGKRWGLDALLAATASAHHRMAWVHPFLDGNGRACRLQTHLAMLPVTGGLWSVNRGLARDRARYYELLSNADMPRQGDLDGRGNLSERALREWVEFFIDTCEDQVTFVARLLDLGQLKQRIAGLVLVRSQEPGKEYRAEAVLPLHHVLAAGPVPRGEFSRMLGLGERTARKVISQLLKDGLLVSDSPKGEVGMGFPLDALHILLPGLYPEAATPVPE